LTIKVGDASLCMVLSAELINGSWYELLLGRHTDGCLLPTT